MSQRRICFSVGNQKSGLPIGEGDNLSFAATMHKAVSELSLFYFSPLKTSSFVLWRTVCCFRSLLAFQLPASSVLAWWSSALSVVELNTRHDFHLLSDVAGAHSNGGKK